MKWEVLSPSNLALIKYMGKKEIEEDNIYSQNIPLNTSLSYTLNHLLTKVSLQKSEHSQDEWRPYLVSPFEFDFPYVYEKNYDVKNKCYRSSREITFDRNLSFENQKKFLDFFQLLKNKFFISNFYVLNSANNFPLSIGAASSASSFSALTLATYKLAKDVSSRKDYIDSLTREDLSAISRLGSGSSCRSFFSPWSLWRGQFATEYRCPFKGLIHQLIVVDRAVKIVSSRQAHIRILGSPYFKGRVQRAEKRFKELVTALKVQDWKKCFEISWAEFKDMHHLFATSNPSFKYKNDLSDEVLNKLYNFWKKKKDGPIVTMDAGANIHLLYRQDQKSRAREIEEIFSSHFVLSSDVE